MLDGTQTQKIDTLTSLFKGEEQERRKSEEGKRARE